MLNPPRTREEAEQRTYGKCPIMKPGFRWVPSRCAYEVLPPGGAIKFQCMRRRTAGPGKLYCRQHARIVEGEEGTE